jgi:hypothetical protein
MSAFPRARPTVPDFAHAIWAFALALVLGVGFFVLRPLEQEIRDAHERARSAAARAGAMEAALTERPRIVAAAARIRADLRRVVLRTDPSAVTIGLILDVQQLSARNGVRVISLRPDGLAAPSPLRDAVRPQTPGRADSDRLGEEADPFELRLHGNFANVVSVVRGLSLMPTLVRVLDVRLERHTGQDPDRPAVDSTIRLLTVRFAADRPRFH